MTTYNEVSNAIFLFINKSCVHACSVQWNKFVKPIHQTAPYILGINTRLPNSRLPNTILPTFVKNDKIS